ncbi:hypothetical protein [Mucilaginibacter flavus]|nr:hypothetical protein [Mucilaginibacter flavus]
MQVAGVIVWYKVVRGIGEPALSYNRQHHDGFVKGKSLDGIKK